MAIGLYVIYPSLPHEQVATASAMPGLSTLTDIDVDTYHHASNYPAGVPAETLSFIIQAGDVLIFNLPTTVGGRDVDAYQLKRSPALSWLVGTSFFWRTLGKDAGKHEVQLTALKDQVVVEDVLIQVDVR